MCWWMEMALCDRFTVAPTNSDCWWARWSGQFETHSTTKPGTKSSAFRGDECKGDLSIVSDLGLSRGQARLAIAEHDVGILLAELHHDTTLHLSTYAVN